MQRLLAAELATAYDEPAMATINRETMAAYSATRDDSEAAAIELDMNYGSTEAAVRALGAAVVASAERHAGITVEQVRSRDADRRATIEQELDLLAFRVANLEMDIELKHDLSGLSDAMEDAFDVWVNAPEGDPDAEALLAAAESAYEDAEAAVNREKAEQAEPMRHRMTQLLRAARQNLPHPDTAADLRRLADGYLRALADVRDMGGRPTFSPISDAYAVRALREVSEVFPTDWIAQHNRWDGDAMVFAYSEQRGRYGFGMGPVAKVTPPQVRRVVGTQAAEPYRNDPAWEVAEDGPVTADDGSTQPSFTVTPYRVVDERPVQADVEPGWEQLADGRWRRPDYELTTSVGPRAEIITNARAVEVAGRTETFTVTAHEMTHRFEATVPGLAQMERDFLERRTTTDGIRETPVSLTGRMSGEMVRADNFVNAYFGKDYSEPGRRAEMFEVMSCGVEGAFAGSYGGLIGTGGKPADLDMLHFVLGALASAGVNRSAAAGRVDAGTGHTTPA